MAWLLVWVIVFVCSASASEAKREILRVLTFYDPFSLDAYEQVGDFEASHDCWVYWDFRYEYELAAMSAAELSEYDVVTVDEPNIARFSRSLMPRESWPNNGNTCKNYSLLDHGNAAGVWRGVVLGKPILLNLYMLAYRADWFDDYELREQFERSRGRSLKPPDTLKELLEINEFLLETTGKPAISPLTRDSEGVTVDLLVFLRSAGVSLENLDDFRRIDRDSLEEALNNYQAFLAARLEGSDDWFIDDLNTAFIRGEVPQIFQWWSLLGPLRDPLFSRVGARTVIRPLPAEEATRNGSITGTWLLAIPKSEQERSIKAVQFIDWWRSQEPDISVKPHLEAAMASYEKAWSRPQLIAYDRFTTILRNAAAQLREPNKDISEIAAMLDEELIYLADLEAELREAAGGATNE